MRQAQEHGEKNRVAASIMETEQQFVLQNYSRYPVVMHRGRGIYLQDVNGKRYIDMITGIGVNALGHGHPRILKLLKEQAGLLMHCSNLYYHEYQAPLAKKLAEISGLQRTFCCNSGAEAMEGAIKMVRSHGRRLGSEKIEIVSLDNSFHGRTMGALSLTGQAKYRTDFEPLLSGVRFVPPDDLAALEKAVGPQTAGIVVEGIQGEGGVRPVSGEFIARARDLADKHNALLVFDEIQCGVGRTGQYFSYQLLDPPVLPDILVAAKPLASGLPLGVIVANEKAAATIAPGMHGSTFGGGALACRIALEFLEMLEELLPHIYQLGGYFRMRLEEFARHYCYIKEVRQIGLMIGVELKIPGKQLVLDALENGLLINCTNENVLRFLPPFTMTEVEADKALKLLEKVLKKGREYFVESGAADELIPPEERASD